MSVEIFKKQFVVSCIMLVRLLHGSFFSSVQVPHNLLLLTINRTQPKSLHPEIGEPSEGFTRWRLQTSFLNSSTPRRETKMTSEQHHRRSHEREEQVQPTCRSSFFESVWQKFCQFNVCIVYTKQRHVGKIRRFRWATTTWLHSNKNNERNDASDLFSLSSWSDFWLIYVYTAFVWKNFAKLLWRKTDAFIAWFCSRQRDENRTLKKMIY